MKLIKTRSELKKHRLMWEQKLIEGMKFVHHDQLSGALTFPLFINSYISTNVTGLYTLNHIYFTAENAKTLLNQCVKKDQRTLKKRIRNDKFVP